MRKGKLQTQLVTIFILISIISALTIMLMSINFTRKSTKDLVSSYTEQIGEQLLYNINDYISIARGAVGDILASEYVKTAVSRYYSLQASEQSELRANINVKVQSVMNTQDMISGVYICSEDKVCYKIVKVKDCFNIDEFKASQAYTQIYEQEQTSPIWFYIGEGNERQLFLVRKAAGANGYIIIMMDMEALTKLLDLANVDTCTFITILDENNEIVATTDHGKTINDEILKQLGEKEEHSVRIIDENIVNLLECTNGWKIISVAPMSNLMSEFTRSCNKIVLVLVVLVGCVALLSIVVGRRVTKPIVAMAQYMKRIEQQNFCIDEELKLDIRPQNQETQMLMVGFTNMLESLKDMISTSKQVTLDAKLSTKELQEQAETTSHSASDISSTTDNIAQGTLKQKEAVEEAVKLVGVLSEKVNKVNEIIEGIRDVSKETMIASSETRSCLSELYNQSEKNILTSKKVSESVQELGEETESINNILDMIQSINKLTNLLAINASIEAARAGESGKGFTVVASEVRKLSLETDNAIKRIAMVVESIEEKRKQTLVELSEAMKVFDKQLPLVNGINHTFSNIYNKMDNIDVQINETNKLIGVVTDTKEAIERQIKGVSQIAEEFVCIIEEVNAQTIEQAQASEKINDLAIRLLESVTSLQESY